MCDRQIHLMAMSGKSANGFTAVQMTDCSPHGLGLNLPEEVKAGEQVLVRVNLNKMVLLVYTIRYCIPTKMTQYRAGARFTGYAANSFQGDETSIVSALVGQE